jgi:hypothetical protein
MKKNDIDFHLTLFKFQMQIIKKLKLNINNNI